MGEKGLVGEKKTQIVFIFVLQISSSYAEILGETNLHTWEFPRSGSKAKDGEKRKKERGGRD